jgi:hypothetical protein
LGSVCACEAEVSSEAFTLAAFSSSRFRFFARLPFDGTTKADLCLPIGSSRLEAYVVRSLSKILAQGKRGPKSLANPPA